VEQHFHFPSVISIYLDWIQLIILYYGKRNRKAADGNMPAGRAVAEITWSRDMLGAPTDPAAFGNRNGKEGKKQKYGQKGQGPHKADET
jgi:hypothetical protein